MKPTIRPACTQDHAAIWRILEPVIRAGETYPLPRDWDRETALAYWLSKRHQTFVAEIDLKILGTYYLRPNQQGGGAHIANCGYITAPNARRRGIASAMCAHSLEQARVHGFRGMQFNFVVCTNQRAIALWEKMGFETMCQLPNVFIHPEDGPVDALIMFKSIG